MKFRKKKKKMRTSSRSLWKVCDSRNSTRINNRNCTPVVSRKIDGRTSDWHARAANSRSTNFPSTRQRNRNNHRLHSEATFVVRVTGIEARGSETFHPPRSKFVVRSSPNIRRNRKTSSFAATVCSWWFPARCSVDSEIRNHRRQAKIYNGTV